MLRLTIPRGEEIALVVISFAALQVVAIGLKSDDEGKHAGGLHRLRLRAQCKAIESRLASWCRRDPARHAGHASHVKDRKKGPAGAGLESKSA